LPEPVATDSSTRPFTDSVRSKVASEASAGNRRQRQSCRCQKKMFHRVPRVFLSCPLSAICASLSVSAPSPGWRPPPNATRPPGPCLQHPFIPYAARGGLVPILGLTQCKNPRSPSRIAQIKVDFRLHGSATLAAVSALPPWDEASGIPLSNTRIIHFKFKS